MSFIRSLLRWLGFTDRAADANHRGERRRAKQLIGALRDSSHEEKVGIVNELVESFPQQLVEHLRSEWDNYTLLQSLSEVQDERSLPLLIDSYAGAKQKIRISLAATIMEFGFVRLRKIMPNEKIAQIALDADASGSFAAVKGVSLDAFNRDPKAPCPPEWQEIVALFPIVITGPQLRELIRHRGSDAGFALLMAIGQRCVPFLLPRLLEARPDEDDVNFRERYGDKRALRIIAEYGDASCIPALEHLGKCSSYVAADCKRALERIRRRTPADGTKE